MLRKAGRCFDKHIPTDFSSSLFSWRSDNYVPIKFFKLPGWRRLYSAFPGCTFFKYVQTDNILWGFSCPTSHLPRPFLIFFQHYYFYFNLNHHPVLHVPGCVEPIPVSLRYEPRIIPIRAHAHPRFYFPHSAPAGLSLVLILTRII